MNIAVFIPIVAIAATAWVLVTFMHYKFGRRSAEQIVDGAGAQENARLTHENQQLRRTVEKLEERTAVLERIATDPAERTAREIEALR
jgi:cell division protein FtsB